MVPFSIHILDPPVCRVIAIFHDVAPAAIIFDPPRNIFRPLSAGIDIYSIWSYCVGQHNAFFIHVIGLLIYSEPGVRYHRAVRLPVKPSALRILLPSGNQAFVVISTGIRAIHIDQVLTNFCRELRWVDTGWEAYHIHIPFIGIHIFIICYQNNPSGLLYSGWKQRPVFWDPPYAVYVNQFRYLAPGPGILLGVEGIGIVIPSIQDYIALIYGIAAYQDGKGLAVSAVYRAPLKEIGPAGFHNNFLIGGVCKRDGRYPSRNCQSQHNCRNFFYSHKIISSCC